MRRTLLMSALVLSTVLGSLDSSFVPLTFSDLIKDLDTTTSEVVWVALAYLIAATGPMLFLARIGDRHGHAWNFRVGTTIYALAMAACGFAPGIRSLVALRALQGLGMALFLPATFSLATRAYPSNERGRALGILASANAFGFIVGPLFAGWLLDAYDWRATFLTRIPLGALAVALAFLAVREPAQAVAATHAELDVRGAALLTAGFFGLLYGLNRLPVEDNHRDPLVWVVFLAGLLVLALFVRHERRTPEPLVDIELYRTNPAFAKASFAFTILFASFPVYLFVLPVVLIAGLELKAWDAGLLLGSVAIVTFLVSPHAGKAADRLGAERLCMIGGALITAGYLAFLALRATSAPAILLVAMALIGIGTGLFFAPNNTLIMSSVPPHRAGMASGLIGTMRQAGYAVGFAVVASLFTALQDGFAHDWIHLGLRPLPVALAERLSHIFEGGGPWSPEALVAILHVAAVLAVGLSLLTVVYSAPRLSLSAQGHLAAIGLPLLATISGMLQVSGSSELRLHVDPFAAPPARLEPASLVVAPFGWAAREPRRENKAGTGAEVFALYCAACHGAEGRGIQGQGLNLATSKFVRGLDDEALIAFLHEGRRPDDAKNTTGKLMPGMKNFPTFGEDDYAQVVGQLRRLNRGGS